MSKGPIDPNTNHGRLMILRRKAGYKNRDDFAKVLGINSSRYCSWETGERRFDFEQVCNICEALGCDPNAIAGISPVYPDDRQSSLNAKFDMLSDENKTLLGYLVTALIDSQNTQSAQPG